MAARLVAAAERELHEVEDRWRRRMAETASADAELRYRRLFEPAKSGFLNVDAGTGMGVSTGCHRRCFPSGEGQAP